VFSVVAADACPRARCTVTKRDGLINTIVPVVSSGSDIDFRVGHGEAPAIKNLVTQLVTGSYGPAPAAPTLVQQPPAGPVAPDYVHQLTQLGQLRDAGVLTDEEFQAKKAELLARM
jgi:hypothetical protein